MTAPAGTPMAEIDFATLDSTAIARRLAVEAPVAFEFNGIAYAVMMATPADLEEFVTGFALSEGLAQTADEIGDVAVHQADEGWIIRANLPPERAAPLLERVRARLVEGSCGLCGLESIEQVMRPLPPVELGFVTSPAAVSAALAALPALQAEGRATGATHAAAFCTPDGQIVALREDVGRHNALDKLIGALGRQGVDPASGFMLVSARCSYELVEKAVRAGCPMLVAISAPTSLAVERALAAGLTLVALARSDTMLAANDPHGMMKGSVDGI